MDITIDEGDCDYCGGHILQDGVLYTDGDRVTCPTCGRPYTVCCSPEEGLHLHDEEDEEDE